VGKRFLTAAALAAVAVGLAGQAVASPNKMYDLGTLPGGTSSVATAINDLGQVTGYSQGPGGQHAFLYSGGVMSDLGTLGGELSGGLGINNKGEVTGASTTGEGDGHAFLYSGGTMHDLGTLDGAEGAFSVGYGINNKGDVVGLSSTGGHQQLAFLYTGGSMQQLAVLFPGAGANASQANGINDNGDIVGTALVGFGRHAVVWSGGTVHDLGTLGFRYNNSSGNAINASGQVAGIYLDDAANERAFFYDGAKSIDIGTLGGDYAAAYGINDAGQVFGYSTLSGSPYMHAFLWTPGWGMKDLGTLGGANAWGLDVNNSGWGVGQSMTAGNDDEHAFLVRPGVPEPGVWAMMLVGLGGLGASLRRRGGAALAMTAPPDA
jgi:probable HAF family extracellular repeat protein